LIRYSLRAAVTSTNGFWPLSEKDIFPLNQKTWAEMAECIGARNQRKAFKQKYGPVSGNTEK